MIKRIHHSNILNGITMNTGIHIPSSMAPLWLLTLLGFLFASLITYVSIPSLVVIAKRKRIYDIPIGRAPHTGDTPNLGGMAILIGFILSTLIIAGIHLKLELVYIISGFVILFLAGIKDDMLGLHSRSKLSAQIVAATLIAIFADIRINDFHGLFTLHEIPYIPSILITIFVFIVIINGYNLIDGIDGLASGICILTSSVLGLWFWKTGNIAYTVMSFALVGSLISFFRYNVFSTKNKIVMGDTGSLAIGLVMAIMTVRFLQMDLIVEGHFAIQSAPAVAVSILIIPLFDTLRIFILRIKQGKSPFVADHQHIHHRLLQLGMTHLQVTVTLLVVNLVFIIMSYLLQGIGTFWLMAAILGTAILLTQFLVFYCNIRARRIMAAEYYAIVKS